MNEHSWSSGPRRTWRRPGRGGARRNTTALLAGLLVCATAGLVWVRSSDDQARADTTPSAVQTGRATINSLGDSGLGNCGFPPEIIATKMYTAAPPGEYADSGGCGTYLDVTGSSGRTVRVLLADKCPECEPGHLDMSPESFEAIAQDDGGVQQISYSPVQDPVLPGPLSVQVQAGSSAYWIGFLVMNHGNPLTSVEYLDAEGSWQALTRTVYNYWHKEDGAGSGPFTLRVTDAYDHQTIVENIELTPNVAQDTGVWMYEGGTPEPALEDPSDILPDSMAPCAAEMTMAGSWPDGYQAILTVRNDGESALQPWQVSWTVADNVTVTGWTGTVAQEGGAVTVVAPDWANPLEPGQSIEVGHVGTGSPVPASTTVELNGAVCADGLD